MQPDVGAYADLIATVSNALDAIRSQTPSWRGMLFIHAERCSFRTSTLCSCRPTIIDMSRDFTC